MIEHTLMIRPPPNTLPWAERKIRNAVGAGITLSVLNLTIPLAAMAGVTFPGFTTWAFWPVLIIAILTYGIWKKDRVCATLLLILYTADRVVAFTEGSMNHVGVFVTIFFIKAFVDGVRGTLCWYRLQAIPPALATEIHEEAPEEKPL